MLVRDLGRADYRQTWESMKAFTTARSAATPDELWLVEHPPVYTLGVAGRAEHLLAPGTIPVVASDRGGQVTYHGPGQVVIYTLVDLRRLGIFVRELVFRIEQSVLQVLEGYGIDGQRVRGAPGVYVRCAAAAGAATEERFAGLAKIAALGIKVHRGCAYHGVALNVATDLAAFAAIDPCGYRGLATVDLATLGVHTDWRTCAGRLAERLQAHLVVADAGPQSAATGG
jgi:lipoyl(octanoyl) transferase